MDNSDDDVPQPDEPVVELAPDRWSTPLPLVLIALLGAAGALLWCLAGPNDPAGRLLIGLTALALGGAGFYGLRARPRLSAGEDGIAIGGVRGQQGFGWSRVSSMRLVRTRRFGREVPTLEVETADPERLHVFSRLELGADPADVLDRLTALRP